MMNIPDKSEFKKNDPFELFHSKYLGTFNISQKLYGRKKEKQLMLDTFERVCNGGIELIFVSGFSGIGKTTLIKGMYGPVIKKKGFFLYGKFDQFQDIPHNAWISAFSELIQILLTEKPAQLQKWKNMISGALGKDAQMIINMIPELEQIIGSQKHAYDADPDKILENLFYNTFIKFIRGVCHSKHPLTIFLDDAQWIDSGSLKILETIMSDASIKHLFIIIAFRDNEVNASHQLKISINKLEEQKRALQHIHLSNLNVTSITQLIADSLHTDKESIRSLAELIVQKTMGNALFSIEFLKSVYSEKLLIYHPTNKQWKWDDLSISKRMVEVNVANILSKRMKKLSPKTIDLLKLASCLGSKFDLLLLSVLTMNEPEETIPIIEAAIEEQYIIPLFTAIALKNDLQTSQLEYKFSHDRIKDAAYSLIPEQEKPAMHWYVGKKLYDKFFDNDVFYKKYCYIIIENLNRGKGTESFQNNRQMLAELNLVMAKKARESFEYQMTYRYSTTGIDCLPDDKWVSFYSLSYDLYWQAAEAASLTRNYDKMDDYIQTLLKYVNKNEDKAKVLLIKIMANSKQNKLSEAIEIGKKALDCLGINLPSKITIFHLLYVYCKISFVFNSKILGTLSSLPEMTDPKKKLILRINTSICFAAYYTCPELLIFSLMTTLDIIKKFGIDRTLSPIINVGFGYLTRTLLKKSHIAYELGDQAIQFCEQYNAKEFEAKSKMVFADFIMPWSKHLKESIPVLYDAYQSGIETGDYEYAASSIYLYNVNLFFSGTKLTNITSHIVEHHKILKKLNQPITLQMLGIYWQTISNFIEPSNDPGLITGKFVNEAEIQQSQFIKIQATLCYMYNCKLMLYYFFGDYRKAFSCAQSAKKYLKSLIGSSALVVYCFYNTLTELAIFNEHSMLNKIKALKRIFTNQKQLKKWAMQSNDNFLHLYYLVKAECYRVLNRNTKAISYYQNAIQSAQNFKYIYIEALANELFAKFYYSKGKRNFARAYIQDAYYCYFQWGALAKVKDIENRYSDIIFDVPSKLNKNIVAQSLIKASQVISKELDLENLLKALMKITIVTADAQQGIFFLKKDHQLTIAAHISRGSSDLLNYHTMYFSDFPPIDQYNNLEFLEKVIYYVDKTCKIVVLDDDNKQRFCPDNYDFDKTNNSPLSVLCLPIMKQNELTGILYLENRRSNDIFSEQKINILEMLSAQIAISITNSINYEKLKQNRLNLERKVAESSAIMIYHKNRIEQEKIIETISDRISQPLSYVNLKLNDLKTYFRKNNLDRYQQITEDIFEKIKKIASKKEDVISYFMNAEDSITYINPASQIHLLLSYFNKFLNAHDIRLIEDISEEIPEIYLNPVKFGQIVIHLLFNALYAINEKNEMKGKEYKKEIYIKLFYDMQKDCVMFEFGDNGVGMRPEILEHCFDPLFTTRKPHGIGLGLYIVKKIVDESNMKIEVDSVEEEGTIFQITI